MSVEPSQATARVLADSDHPNGQRLTTMEVKLARSALAEFNTHRAFSRNSASSRAIPVKKMLAMAEEDPFIPRRFSLAQKGMSASEFVQPGDGGWDLCLSWWLDSRDRAIASAKGGLDIGLHKQDVNRILEPFLQHTVIVSATDWDNFYDLRLALDAEGNPLAYPPMYDAAKAMQLAMVESTPKPLAWTWWHLPLIGFPGDETLTRTEQIKVSVARCARVSYLSHAGERDVEADLTLYERLTVSGHWSPHEHPARPDIEGSGNFKAWKQARWFMENGKEF